MPYKEELLWNSQRSLSDIYYHEKQWNEWTRQNWGWPSSKSREETEEAVTGAECQGENREMNLGLGTPKTGNEWIWYSWYTPVSKTSKDLRVFSFQVFGLRINSWSGKSLVPQHLRQRIFNLRIIKSAFTASQVHIIFTSNMGAIYCIRLYPVNTDALAYYLFDSAGCIWWERSVLIARNSNAFSKSGHVKTEWLF